MLYETYEARLKRKYFFKRLIYKYRILLIAVASIITLFSVTFVSAKGIVIQIEYPNTLNYGETFTIESHAIFSDQTYEYSIAGLNQWSTTVPRTPGDYEVKVISKNAFNHNKETMMKFTISPRPVDATLVSENIVFGESPMIELDLLEGDWISNVTFRYHDISQESTLIEIESIQILNADAIDVTDYYNIKFNETLIHFVPQSLEITLLDYTAEYSGDIHSSNDYQITSGKLLDHHVLEITTSAQLTNAGSIINTIDSMVILDGDIDVTDNYQITTIDAQLTINKKPLTIQLNDVSKIYDGHDFSYSDFNLIDDTDLISGHTIEVITQLSYIDVGNYANHVDTVLIKDGDLDVTGNYDITSLSGVIEILPRIISIESHSSSSVYDGLAYGDYSWHFLDGDLADGDTIELFSFTHLIDVGQIDNDFNYVIKDSNGRVVNDNYQVNKTLGQIQITPRYLTIRTGSASKIYDGSSFSHTSWEIIQGDLAINHQINLSTSTRLIDVGQVENQLVIQINDIEAVDVTSNYMIQYQYGTLAITQRYIKIDLESITKVYDGSSLIILDAFSILEGTMVDNHSLAIEMNVTDINVGLKDIEDIRFEIKDQAINVTNNYQIDYVFDSIEVIPRPLTILSESSSREYDGSPLTNPLWSLKEGVLIEGHHLVVSTEGQRISVGQVDNDFNYTIHDLDGFDVSHNYQVTKEIGLLSITPRVIVVDLGVVSKVYDGSVIFLIDDWSILEGSLVVDHTYQVMIDVNNANIGLKDIEDIYFEIKHQEINVTNNYQIEYVFDSIEVTPRPLTLRSDGSTKVYDGETLTNPLWSITSGSLVEGHSIDASTSGHLTNVGDVENAIDYLIKDLNDFDVSHNYLITNDLGVLTITPRPISVSTEDANKIYDGEALNHHHWSLSSGTLIGGHTLEISFNSSITSVGQTANDFTFMIKDNQGLDISENYQLSKSLGSLEILPRPITISTGYADKEFDGSSLKEESWTILEGSLVDGHFINITFISEITFVGQTENDFNHQVFDIDNNDLTNNYIITKDLGVLEINHRMIKVDLLDVSKIYDGTNLFILDEWLVLEGSLVDGHTFSIDLYTNDIHVGNQVLDDLTIHIFDENINISHNYLIEYVIGEIAITLRPITIQSGSSSRMYDGTPLINTSWRVIEGSIASPDLGHLEPLGSITNVGQTSNDFNFSIKHLDDDVSFNYAVTKAYGLLEVTPRIVHVNLGQITKIYDGTTIIHFDEWIVLEGSLVEGHSWRGELITFDPNIGFKDIDEVRFFIFNQDQPVTDNYQINYVYDSVEITPRLITIQSGSATKVYDGLPLTDDSWVITEGRLADHQSLDFTNLGTITNVGNVHNAFSFMIKDILDQDVSFNYLVTKNHGLLEITPRLITIQSGSASKTYDGLPLIDDSYVITEGSLAVHQSLDYTNLGTITNVGDVHNTFSFVIKDIHDQDVSSNYQVTEDQGVLEITPRLITIQSGSASKIYDGLPLIEDSYVITEGSLADHQSLDYTNLGTIINVGDVLNTFSFVIKDLNDQDVSANYQVTEVQGVLEITHRIIKVDLGAISKIYDGSTSIYQDHWIMLEGSLVENHTFTIEVITNDKHAGSKQLDQLIIEINDFETLVTNNYLIEAVYESIEIIPRTITIQTGSSEKIYDGLPLVNHFWELIEGTLVKDETMEVIIISTITNVSNINNDFNFSIKDIDDQDVTGNYQLTKDLGTLEISPRPITVQTSSAVKIYDDTPLFNHHWQITEGSLVDGQLIEMSDFHWIIDVGVVNNDFVIEIFDGNNQDVAFNYDITKDLGLLEVTPRVITIRSGSSTKTYDGLPLSNHHWHLTKGSLIDGHQLDVTIISEITDVGKIFNLFTSIIVNQLDDQITNNYIIVADLGVLEVVPLEDQPVLRIKSVSDAKIYDGTPLTNHHWLLLDELEPGHYIEVEVTGEITLVGVVDNLFTFTIYDEFDQDVTNLYTVKTIYGRLTILDGSLQNGNQSNQSIMISNLGQFNEQLLTDLFKLFSDRSGLIYLRDRSYGDYNHQSWNQPLLYEINPSEINPLGLPGFILGSYGYIESELTLTALAQNLSYYLPYYATSGLYSLNDVFINHPYGLSYTIQYIDYAYDFDFTNEINGDHPLELAYRDFVYQQYLDLPYSTYMAFLELAELNGLDPNSDTIIKDVQNYILNAGIYNLSYRQIPSNGDFALLFLTETHEGICQHFATAATVMYRALGIPARYVTGYATHLIANDWVTVNSLNAHAWVEIYIDGFGWIPIEVTPSTPDGDKGYGLPHESQMTLPDNEDFIEIDIISGNAAKKYDGLPLSNDSYRIGGTLLPGHRLDIDFDHEITQIGSITNHFNVVILNEDDEDVTNLYSITKIYGKLSVLPNDDRILLEINVYDKKMTYNGLNQSLNDTDFWISSRNLPDGYTIDLDILGSQKNVGYTLAYVNHSSIKIYDESGHDVTNRFVIVSHIGILNVVKREITITTLSAEKYDDELPLSYPYYHISRGSLVIGDELFSDMFSQITEVGVIDNEIHHIIIKNSENEDVTDNYKITIVLGKLTILEP